MTAMRSPFRDALTTALLLTAAVAIVAAIGTQLSGGTQRIIIDAMIKMIIVLGMYIFVGNSGLLSFGHIGFLGLGAYTAAWLTIPPSIKASLMPGLPDFLATAALHPLPAALAGGAAASLAALLVGIPLTRLAGVAASIGTFAMLVVFYAIFSNWTSVTGGQGSLYGLPVFTSLPVAAGFTVATILGAAMYQASASGFRLRGSREDAVAAQASGIDIRRERLIAFVISAFFVGVAGALYAHFLQVVVAREFYLKLTFITVAMLVIGGMRSLSGAVAGTAFVAFLSEVLRQAERGIDLGVVSIGGRLGLQEVGLAIAMLIVLIFRPRGITGGRELTLGWRSR
ncbi:branched-chain amino acid ABC transporter permease [Vineibacter terrae]|uniref:Branched-chain amino acid ABC transporter permease n=2 Tax=Vineibacter terrae TaxID=2586908 RepID=A0A5C8PG84_9HYPH|nr:branched-chain amino acid ABC transporter permease [Vineibacter terrae]